MDQLERDDIETEDEMASDLMDLINSDSLKGDLDDLPEGPLDDSWNYSDYFLNSQTSARSFQSSLPLPWLGGRHENLILLGMIL